MAIVKEPGKEADALAPSASPARADRRRPGRPAAVNPTLIPLLRNPTAPEATGSGLSHRSRDDVSPEKEIGYAVITTDLAGRITGWNTGAAHMLGWSGSEVLGRDAALIWTPEDRDAGVPEQEMRTALEQGSAAGERWHIRRDGARFWAAGQLTPLHDGGLRGYLKILRDHTEQRAAAERLGQSEERFRLIVDGVPDHAIFTLDREGRVTSWNSGAERILGWTEADILGRDAAVLYNSEDRDAGEPAAEMAAALLERHASGERWMLRRDGTQFWAAQTLTQLLDANGKGWGFLKILRDRTKARLAEVTLQRLNGALEAEIAQRTKERDRTWRLSQDLLMVVRFDTTLVAVNPAWTATLDWKEKELVGRPLLDLIHPDDRAAELATARSLADGLPKARILNRCQHRDGSWHWFAWTAVADEGLIYATGRDVTAEKDASEALRAAEEQLHQAQKMEAMGQLTGGIAHDFNNMLQGIGGSLEMLQRRVDQGRLAEASRYVEGARKGIERAAALTQRLLTFARKQRLQPQPVDADALIPGMEELIQRTIGPSIGVQLRLRDCAWPVLCDPNQLESALLNLAINAADAMPEGGRLTIATQNVRLSEADVAGEDGALPGNYVEISVTDTGMGMAADVLKRAFEPFFTTKSIGHRTGLGLSQLHGFVRQSRGVVRLSSVPGRGTTVRLFLPRYEDANAASS